jgi:hypothetical protein
VITCDSRRLPAGIVKVLLPGGSSAAGSGVLREAQPASNVAVPAASMSRRERRDLEPVLDISQR